MINDDVLKNAISLLRGDMGDIEGLPLELQNTIANIYYKLSQHALNVSGDNKLPRSVTGAKNLANGYKGYIEEAVFLLECRKSLPEMVAILKKEIIGQKSQSDIDFVTLGFSGVAVGALAGVLAVPAGGYVRGIVAPSLGFGRGCACCTVSFPTAARGFFSLHGRGRLTRRSRGRCAMKPRTAPELQRWAAIGNGNLVCNS